MAIVRITYSSSAELARCPQDVRNNLISDIAVYGIAFLDDKSNKRVDPMEVVIVNGVPQLFD